MRKNFSKIILIVILPLVIILLNFKLIAFNIDFYKDEFSKYKIYSEYSKELVDDNTIKLLEYLKGEDNLETEFFNEKEKLHLSDVKNIIRNLNILFYALITILLISLTYLSSKKKIKDIGLSFIYGSLLTLIFIISLLIIIKFKFGSAFTIFHKIFFKNNLWLLNPEKDNLINLFPQGFFYDIVSLIIINIIVTSTILIIFGFLIIKVKKYF